MPRPPPPPEPVREPPPIAEVREVWERCRRVLDARDVVEWLRARAIHPPAVEDEDLARLAPGGLLPAWAAHWANAGVVLVVPLFDTRGQLAGLQGRAPEGRKKSIRMQRVACGGLVLASGAGRRLLELGHWPDVEPLPIEVVEGEMDLLSVLSRRPGAALLGLPGTGSWTADVAARIPDGAEVHVATHQDEAGEDYAALIRRTLHPRCRLRRVRWAP